MSNYTQFTFGFGLEKRQFFQENDTDEMYENVYEDVESLLVMPINHINAYAKFLDELVNEYKHRNVFTDKFKTIAAVEVEMKRMQKSVLDNYNLNAMKGGTVSVLVMNVPYCERILSKIYQLFVIAVRGKRIRLSYVLRSCCD